MPHMPHMSTNNEKHAHTCTHPHLQSETCTHMHTRTMRNMTRNMTLPHSPIDFTHMRKDVITTPNACRSRRKKERKNKKEEEGEEEKEEGEGRGKIRKKKTREG